MDTKIAMNLDRQTRTKTLETLARVENLLGHLLVLQGVEPADLHDLAGRPATRPAEEPEPAAKGRSAKTP